MRAARKLRAVLAAVSPLCGAIFRSTPFIKLRRIHLHPYAHKGKKEKASFFLF